MDLRIVIRKRELKKRTIGGGGDMAGKVIVVCIIILVILLFIYLFGPSRGTDNSEDRNAGKSEPHSEKKGGAKSPKIPVFTKVKPVEIADAPVLYVKRMLGNGEDYRLDPFTMKYQKYTIGSDPDCDLVLNADPKVEGVHAIIEKHVSGSNVFYVLKSQARINPTDFKYKAEDNYKRLGRGDSIELEKDNFIYVGDTQIIITLPEMGHVHTNTIYVSRTTHSDDSKKPGDYRESDRVASPKDKEIQQSIYFKRNVDV